MQLYYIDRLDLSSIKSFIIVFYDEQFAQLGQYAVPIKATARFADRLFRVCIPEVTVNEPWYSLVPYSTVDRPFKRSNLPKGLTSLYSKPYYPDAGQQPHVQLHPQAYIHYFVARLFNIQTPLYEGEYSVDDIFLHVVNYLLHSRIKKGEIKAGLPAYYYEIVPSPKTVTHMEADMLPADAYEIEGIFQLPPRKPNEPRIQFRKVLEPPLPERDPQQLFPPEVETHGKGEAQAGHVFIPHHVYELWRRSLALSDRDEEGGYILGNVYRRPNSPERESDADFRWIVEVTDIVKAENTIGSPATLLFTSDTWSRFRKRQAKEFPERKLVGWFHTHLFGATDSFGLSGLDQDMHAWYLPRPWQMAILLNFEIGADRTVRCYQRGPGGDLVETPYTVF